MLCSQGIRKRNGWLQMVSDNIFLGPDYFGLSDIQNRIHLLGSYSVEGRGGPPSSRL